MKNLIIKTAELAKKTSTLQKIPSFRKRRHRNELINCIDLLYYAVNYLHHTWNRTQEK